MPTEAELARNRYASTLRHYADDPDRVEAARRDLAVAKVRTYIEKVVAAAPPFTDAQRAELTHLLRGGGR